MKTKLKEMLVKLNAKAKLINTINDGRYCTMEMSCHDGVFTIQITPLVKNAGTPAYWIDFGTNITIFADTGSGWQQIRRI